MNDDPQTIGPYRVLRRLGSGGMGVVYLAHDPKLDRPVAIKSVRPDLLDNARAAARFRREARNLAQLRHPYLVQIYDVFEHAGREHVVMEYVEGHTLDQLVAQDKRPDIERVKAILSEVLDGLSAAHERGIVHRDLKAENVMSAPDGHIKILDFGLAKKVDKELLESSESDATLAETLSREAISEQGVILGTGYTMAPEQARGLTVDTRADLFALGVLAYLLLTGQRPFQGVNRADLLARICGERQRPITDLRPELPARLSDWVDHLLEKSPEDRPVSARVALEALHRISDSPVTPPSGPSDAPASNEPIVLDLASPSPITKAATATSSRRARWPWLAAIVMMIGLWLVMPHSSRRRSVVVLDPVNTSGRQDLDWWGVAVSEALATHLASSAELKVLSPTWVADTRRQLSRPAADSEDLLTALGAELVVRGSYVPLDEHNQAIQLNLRLENVTGKAEQVFWGESRKVTKEGIWSTLDLTLSELHRKMDLNTPGQAMALELSFPSTEAAQLYAEGVGQLRVLDAQGAVERLEAARDLDPLSPRIRQSLADAYAILGRRDEAQEAMLAALELPLDGLSQREVLLFRAGAHAFADERSEAAAIYSRIFNIESDNLDLGLRYAEALRLDGRPAEALALLESLQSLPLSSEDPRLHLEIARAAYQVSDFRRMLAAIGKAEDSAVAWGAPTALSAALLYKSIAYSSQGNGVGAERAMRESQEVAKTVSNDLGHLRLLARAANRANKSGDLALAESLYLSLIEGYHQLGNRLGAARATMNLASALSRAGRYDEALELFRNAGVVFDQIGSRHLSAISWLNMANIQLRLGDAESAAAVYETTIAIFQELGQESELTLAIANLAEARFQLNQLQAAEDLFEQARKRKANKSEPDHYELLFLGRIAHRRGLRQRAEDLFRQAARTADIADDFLTRTQAQLAHSALAFEHLDLELARDLTQRALETAEGNGMEVELEIARKLMERVDAGQSGEP